MVTRKPYRGNGGTNVRTFVGRQEARGMMYSEFQLAEEVGRYNAAIKLAADPTARARVEAVYGIQWCKNRYPEVYAKTR